MRSNARPVLFCALSALALAACSAGGPSDPSPAADAAGPTQQEPDAAPSGRLPMVVDDYYAPSGYMGDGSQPGAIEDDECQGNRGGEGRGLCHRFTWSPAGMNWAGVFWQFPAGNWGEEPGLDVPEGATRVSFYAWGASGGEQVGFMVGMSDVDGFEVKEENVILTSEPTRYELSLESTGYGQVVGGFGWVAEESTNAVVFFVDDIVWE